jgi:hypothetical protein
MKGEKEKIEKGKIKRIIVRASKTILNPKP